MVDDNFDGVEKLWDIAIFGYDRLDSLQETTAKGFWSVMTLFNFRCLGNSPRTFLGLSC